MITEGLMQWGDMSVPLVSDTPGEIVDLLNRSWYGLIKIYAQGTPFVDDAPALFTGVILDRPDRYTIAGASAVWFLGEASDGKSNEELGPLTSGEIFKDGSSSGSVTGWFTSIIEDTVCGLTVGDIGGPPSSDKYAGTFTRRTAKTMLDTWVVPRFGVEYRVNPDLSVDVGFVSELFPLADPPPMAVRRGGRDPNVIGLTASQLALHQSVRDQVSRVISVVDDPLTYQAIDAGTWPYKNPQGDDLNWTMQKSTSLTGQPDTTHANGQAHADAVQALADRGKTVRTIDVSTTEFALTSRVGAGAKMYVYDADEGLFDMSNVIPYRGQLTYPVLLRVQQVQWPIQAGMSVALDNRHQGGTVTNLTRYIDFSADGTGTTITVGAPPKTLGRAVRLKR